MSVDRQAEQEPAWNHTIGGILTTREWPPWWEGRFIIEARHAGYAWEVIVEPDDVRTLLVVITAYPVDRAES